MRKDRVSSGKDDEQFTVANLESFKEILEVDPARSPEETGWGWEGDRAPVG